MDWRLNGRNAEQNYKIIIDKKRQSHLIQETLAQRKKA